MLDPSLQTDRLPDLVDRPRNGARRTGATGDGALRSPAERAEVREDPPTVRSPLVFGVRTRG